MTSFDEYKGQISDDIAFLLLGIKKGEKNWNEPTCRIHIATMKGQDIVDHFFNENDDSWRWLFLKVLDDEEVIRFKKYGGHAL